MAMKVLSLIALAVSTSALRMNQPFPQAQKKETALPIMGYNTWNDLDCDSGRWGGKAKMTEQNVLDTAAKMKELGLLDVGYKYFTLDDCWQDKRDEHGELTAAPHRFSSGMKEMGEKLHGLGYKFGLYTSRGSGTCAGRVGSLDHEKEDARTFAKWGVDLVKNDGCGDHDCWSSAEFEGKAQSCTAEGRAKALSKYARMREELNDSGRSIVHAVSGWQPWYGEVGQQVGDSWRIHDDVRGWPDVYSTSRVMEQLTENNGKKGWNDPDMLVGSSASASKQMEPKQSRAQFSLWSVMGAPLIIGTSVLNMSKFDLETYSNKEAIRVNQDPLGRAGKMAFTNCPLYPKFQTKMSPDSKRVEFKIDTSHMDESSRVSCGYNTAKDCASCGLEDNCHGNCKWDTGNCKWQGEDDPVPYARLDFLQESKRQCQQAWMKPLSGGEVAVAIVNFAKEPKELQVSLADLWGKSPPKTTLVEDLWTGEKYNVQGETLLLKLEAEGGHHMLKLSE